MITTNPSPGTAGSDTAAPAPAARPGSPRYSARQFFQSVTYAPSHSQGHGFTPDGAHILVSHDASGVFNAYLLPVGGGAAVPLTHSADHARFAISAFPADGRVLFGGDTGGNELSHLFVREEDGAIRDLTPGDKHKAIFAGWKADGSAFYLGTNERDPQAFDLYAYAADTYARAMVFENSGAFLPGEISGDGKWLALSKPRTSADSDLYLAELAPDGEGGGGEPQRVTPHEGDIAYGIYGFTRDAAKLVFATDEHGEFNQAWTHDLATGERAPLIEAEWDVMYVQHSPSGRYRVSAINADGSTVLTVLDTQSGTPVALNGLPQGDITGVRFSADESRIAFSLASDTSPADIYTASLATGAAVRLTHALNPEIAEEALVEASVARFASWDGTEVPGMLYRPRGADADRPAPALVYVHGGPGGQSRRGYSAQIQHLVNHGYAVFAINNRGSSGYGKTFFHMDDKRHGDVDLKDVVASKAFLQRMDWIADDRIGIIGGSYGGYMAVAALTFHPEVFDAGIDIFGVTNWVRTLESIPAWWGAQRDALYDEMGDPATDGERHRAISPLFHAERICRPMLVVQGANDPRVLKAESDELVAAMQANGVPVEYIVFPDEGHGFLKKENRVAASEAYLAFLQRYVAP